MKKDQIIAVIPVRMGSSRFPGKPLATLLARPMIEHVLRRTLMCSQFSDVYVATCDGEISEAVERIGGRVIMTSAGHQRSTDRVAEAADRVAGDIVVMIQGDEPMIRPEMLAQALAPMTQNRSVGCVNLAHRISKHDEYLDRNTIKVVMNAHGQALYFSRAPIPAVDFAKAQHRIFKQVCVIPFRREVLCEFARLRQTPLEQAESIDMLRLLENGLPVRLVETEYETHAVDTPEDLRLVEKLMENDPLIGEYAAVDGLLRGL